MFAVHDLLVVRVLDGVAHLQEEAESLLDGQPVLVGELGQRPAVDMVHHEVRAARRRGARVEHLGHMRMVHEREQLDLLTEPLQHGLGIEPLLDDLDRHLLLEVAGALGEPHGAEAARAELGEQLVVADLVALALAAAGGGVEPRRHAVDAGAAADRVRRPVRGMRGGRVRRRGLLRSKRQRLGHRAVEPRRAHAPAVGDVIVAVGTNLG